jgi:purine-nucleoside phosphorylase
VRLTLESILASRRCKAILSIGYAGALHDGHRVGDLLIPEELRALPPLNPGIFYPDAQLFQELCQLARDAGRAFHSHRMVTSDRVIATTREKRTLGQIYHAGGVDMESSVVAEIATRATIPFAVIRVVSDSVSFTMPDLSILQYARRKQYLNIARYLLFKPGQTLRILTLRRYGRRAADSLTAFLAGEALDALIQIPQRPPALTAEA